MDPSMESGPPPGAVATPIAAGPPPGAVATPIADTSTSGPNPTGNPNGEGTYQMKTPAGVQAIPYSKIEQAKQTPGNDFASVNEYARYTKDRAYDPTPHASNGYIPPEVEQAKGALKSAVQVPNTLVGWLDAITDKAASLAGAKNPESGDVKPRLEKAENAVAPGITNPIHGFQQGAGGFAENLAEWLYGEGEARAGYEALSQSQKLEKVAKAAKFIEEHPALAGTLRAAATGAGSGAQAAVHGATPGQAGEAAVIGGGAAGVGELIGGTVRAARTAQAASEAATTERESTQAAYENRGAVTKQRTEAMQNDRQATAQQGIRDVVKDSARRVADRVNEAMQPPLAITGEPVEGYNFQPIQGDELASKVNNFGDLADQTRTAIKPIVDKLDEASGGELSRLQAERSQAFSDGDRAAQADADKKIDDLAAEHRDVVTPEQYKAWRTSYADSKVLDDLHQATERSFNGLSEEMAAQPGTGTRKLRGTPYQNQLGKFLQNYGDTRVSRILGEDGLANLHRAANLVSSPETRKATMELAEQVAAEFPKPAEPEPESSLKDTIAKTGAKMAGGAAVGAAISHVTGLPHLVTEPAGATVAAGAKYVLQKMVTSPRIGQLMEYAVRNKVTPKVAAGLISSAMIQENQSQQEEKKEDQQ